MSIYDIFKYLLKWKYAIAAVVLAAFLASAVYVKTAQTYNAQVVVQYADACISDGYAPDETVFDCYEIVSPNVITNVIKSLKLKKTVEEIRSGVTITPLIPSSEEDMRESKLEDGEEYTYYPNTFTVTYEGRDGEAASEVRDILESIIQNYTEFYTKKYIKLASANDIAYDEEMGDYDYIELADALDGNIEETIITLENYYETDAEFRSSVTGLSFLDIRNEYEYLRSYIMPGVFTDIYRGQITKNELLLLNKYVQKKEQLILEQRNHLEQAALARDRMEAFANANKQIPNAYNVTTKDNDDKLAIIDDVHYGEFNNTTTTYDELMDEYVTASTAADESAIYAEECQRIVDIFSAPTDPSVDVASLTLQVENAIASTAERLKELYKTVNLTIADFNANIAVKHFNVMTGVQHYQSLSLLVYGFIAVTLGLFASAAGVIAFELYRASRKKSDEEAA